MGFENGRPMSGNNPNLLRGPPNQFKDFLENKVKEPYVSKLELGKRPIATSRGNPEKVGSNFVVSKDKQIALYWPANEGFMQGSVLKQTRVGERIDRWGSPEGKYASPAGTPFELRGLPPKDKISKPYFVYEVVKPFEVRSGKVMPAFGQIGQGIQYRLPMKIRELVDLGYLQEVKNESR
ncbi:MAG: TNT domain-containing protein [Elusimicrobia bacterium]|nr:TNT domain-containing protein [Elusimicrobiota bacterium]